ncbi:MAG: hypothetical protein LRY46_03390 [Candidatus Pacebacteria bacterium]|nr:hypothetical protein [Candidatus Paceibacterota bacterium]
MNTPSIPPAPKKSPESKTSIRSMYHDIDAVMRQGQTGTLAGALKEYHEEEREKKEASLQSPKNIFLLILSTLLIVGGGVLIIFALGAQVRTPENTSTPLLATKVPVNIQTGIQADATSRFALYTKINDAIALNTGTPSLQYIYFVTNTTQGGSLVSASSFFERLEIRVPESLMRALDTGMMYGTFRNQETLTPYLILDVTSFDRAFIGMQDWENSLLRDLAELFMYDTSVLTPENIEGVFESRTIQNIPTRILTRQSIIPNQNTSEDRAIIPQEFINIDHQNILLSYAFLDESTVVITTTPDLIHEMRRRIRERQF